jgi:pyruvate/2-oxoglutarate dehydrogenase complex dihydrolipoamide dehydrogenase (E3) component
MPQYDYDIGVIGGGAGGLTVTAGASQLGAKTILIEKEGRLGGDCLHYGSVPSKTLIKTAHVYHLMKHAKEFGLPAIDPGPVDFRDVAARIQSVINTIQEHDSEERFCKLGAQVEFGDPVFADEHTMKVGGKTFNAKYWVISTGSSPAVPKIEGLEGTPFITNRELFSLDSLPASMIILGAGPIAIEMAQAFARLGTKVAVVQRGSQILSREDRDMADLLMEVLRSEGIDFHLESQVVSVKNLGVSREVTLMTGERQVKILGDTLLVALGRAPNVQDLGLEHIGVNFTSKGIETDQRLRTNHKHIYAAGDTTGKYLFTHAAGYEGGIVVSNAIFRLPRRVDYTFFPWCTYTSPSLANIGMNEKMAQEAGVEYKVWTEEFRMNDRALAEGESVGKIKLIVDASEKPLGVQILGPHAGDLINEWVAALSGKVKLTTLAAAVHPYPTLGEINKRVAGELLASKIFSEKVRKGLKFFFHLKGRACGLEPRD